MKWLVRLLTGSDLGGKKKGAATEGPQTVNESDFDTTSSGLQYCDLVVGGGQGAAKGQSATVHYTGWLTNGNQFDSSVKRDKPFTFVVGNKEGDQGLGRGRGGYESRRQAAVEGAAGIGIRSPRQPAGDSPERDPDLRSRAAFGGLIADIGTVVAPVHRVRV